MAAAAGLFVANATPAFAAVNWDTRPNGATGVEAWGAYNIDGRYCDISAVIQDTRADGHRAGVQLKNTNVWPTAYAYRYNTGGYDTEVIRYFYDALYSMDGGVYIREFVSEGAIENGGRFVDKGEWKQICTSL
jgi:hypothetical protein